MTFISTTPGNNVSTRTSWLAAVGEAPDFIQDFETGFVDEQVINGPVGDGMSITGIGPGPGGLPWIESGTGSIGGSNPIDRYAVEASEGSGVQLTLSFDTAIDYLAFYVIDVGSIRVNWSAGTAQTTDTGAGGDSAEFAGFVFEGPVSTVTFENMSGSAGWALDKIEFGRLALIPVPAGAPLLLTALAALGWMRRRRG